MDNRISKMRIYREMKEFDDKVYISEFEFIEHLGFNKIKVTMYDGTLYIIERSDNFFEAPTVYAINNEIKNTKINECSIEFSPAYTSAKWILMMHNLI